VPVPSAVMRVPWVIVPLLVSVIPTAIVPLETAVTVKVVPLVEPVKTACVALNVCVASMSGADAVTVPPVSVSAEPLVGAAESVVNAPELRVVSPIAGGAAKLLVRAMVPDAVGGVSV